MDGESVAVAYRTSSGVVEALLDIERWPDQLVRLRAGLTAWASTDCVSDCWRRFSHFAVVEKHAEHCRFFPVKPTQLCEVHMRKVLLIATVSLSTLFAAPTHAMPIAPVGSQVISGSDLIEVKGGHGLVVMVGDEVMAIVTMAGAVVGRSGGEVTTVRPVTGRKAGANPILYRKGQA